MKHTRVSLLALSVLAGGVVIASAANTDTGTNYYLNADITTDPAPEMVQNVYNLPMPSSTDIEQGYYNVLDMDGAGKLDGVTDLMVTNLTDMGPYSTCWFIATVKGNVKSSGKTPVTMVKMQVKGNGYAQDTTSQSAANINFNFTSTSGLQSMNSSVGPFMSRTFILYLNPDGTTNYTSFFYPNANENYAPAYTNVQFNYRYSDIYTNVAGGTNFIYQYNDAYDDEDDYNFGTPIGGASYTNVFGTNNFPVYPIGYYAYYSYSATNWFTNYTYGFNIDAMPLVIAAYQLTYSYVNPYGNGTEVQRYEVTTNSVSADSYTNSSGLFRSNYWSQITGTLKGQIKAGKEKHSLNGESATLYEGHTLYSTASDTNGTYIVAQQFYSSGLSAGQLYAPDARVVTWGKKLWMSEDNYGTYGQGNLDSKKNAFKANLKGVGWGKGAKLKFAGSTGPLITGETGLTNVVTIVNIAATPLASIDLTNMGYTYPVWQSNYADDSTNVLDSTNILYRFSNWDIYVPPDIVTNTVPNGIKDFTLSGKLMGQTLPPDVSGTNYDNY